MTTFCAYYTGQSTVEVKIEADSDDVTEHPHSRPYVCTVCDKQFRRKHHLNRHKQTHVRELHACDQCDKCYVNEESLRQHMYVHSSKYKCTECGKCFS